MHPFRVKDEFGKILWFPNNRISHFYFIARDDGHLDLIDTSAPIERLRIKFYIAATGKSIKRLLLTHSHADHAGSAAYVAKTHQCEVFAHALELPYLKGEASMNKRDYSGINAFGRIIQFGDWLYAQPIHKESKMFAPELDDEYEFVPLHGHTRGSTGIIHKATRSIFLGDALLNCSAIQARPQPGLRIPYACFSEDQEAAISSLKNLEDAHFDNAFFGHGNPIIGNAKKVILDFLATI
jgi:glyoxylase-like metal-dependent hydrolase (beta-lactamase superfamily II)